jgi:hypothetical protein
LISESKLGKAAGSSVPHYRMAGVVGALMS